MKIFKKMLQYFALLLGLALVAILIMFFCMYFFNTKFFGYGWKSASKNADSQEFFNPYNIEVNTKQVSVEILLGTGNTATYKDSFSGIVKAVKHDDGTLSIPPSTINIVDDYENKKTTITVNEPEKGIFSTGKTKLQIYVNESFLQDNVPNLIINSLKSSVNVDLGENRCNIVFNSNNRANLTVLSPVNSLSGNYEIGKLICTKDVGYADIETKNGTLQIDGAVVGTEDKRGDVNVSADNANIKLNEVRHTLTYRGKNGDSASGGKISAKIINDGLTINSRSFDATITKLNGGCNVVASTNGNISIENYSSSESSKKINVNKGNVNLSNLDVDNIEIETTSGNVNINTCSEISKKLENKIIVKTSGGNINVNAKITNNETDVYYIGTLDLKSANGDIIIKDVNSKDESKCVVNACSTGKGKVVCYFNSIANLSSLETNSGELIVDLNSGFCPALLNVIAANKSINVVGRDSFYDKTKPTPIYNALDMENPPILTIISKTGKVQIKEF